MAMSGGGGWEDNMQEDGEDRGLEDVRGLLERISDLDRNVEEEDGTGLFDADGNLDLDFNL
jgi:hypothetical protein